MDIEDEIRTALKTVSLVGFSTVISLFLYLAIAEFIRARFRPFRGFAAVADVQPLRYLFFGGAIVAVILVRVLRHVLLKEPPGTVLKTALHRLQRVSLVTIVLAEVPAILGLILFLLAGLNIDLYILLLVSIVLVFMYFPRRASWEAWLRGL
jgi:hypothetical protein